MKDSEIVDLNLELHTEKGEPCKGQVYRARANAFINKRGEVVYTERMVPLKRESCPGCDQCGSLIDELREWMDYGPIIKEFKHGAKYRLAVTNISHDWETGHVDDYDLEFVEMP